MNRSITTGTGLALFLLVVALPSPRGTSAQTGIVATKHNLSASGPGELKALTETRICVFCHTPHNAQPATPLWNKKIEHHGRDAGTAHGTVPALPELS